jgi:hypothetical protein
MRAELEHTAAHPELPRRSETPSRYGAIQDPMGQPVNWVLLLGLLGCLSFWGAVVLGVVAAV